MEKTNSVQVLIVELMGGIHAAQTAFNQLKEDFSTSNPSGFFLIDAKNAFNQISRVQMLWAARHLWPSCAQFLFNPYKHWGQLHIRSSDGNSSLIHSKEGVTQGDPLAMTAYGIGILPLIKHLQL